MVYKFCDHKVTGEDHLVSNHIWHTVTARPSYGLVVGKIVTELLDMNFKLKLL